MPAPRELRQRLLIAVAAMSDEAAADVRQAVSIAEAADGPRSLPSTATGVELLLRHGCAARRDLPEAEPVELGDAQPTQGAAQPKKCVSLGCDNPRRQLFPSGSWDLHCLDCDRGFYLKSRDSILAKKRVYYAKNRDAILAKKRAAREAAKAG